MIIETEQGNNAINSENLPCGKFPVIFNVIRQLAMLVALLALFGLIVLITAFLDLFSESSVGVSLVAVPVLSIIGALFDLDTDELGNPDTWMIDRTARPLLFWGIFALKLVLGGMFILLYTLD